MTKSLCAVLAASLCVLPLAMHAADTFKDDKDKVSYSIGVDMGRNMAKQGVDINPDILVSGLKDGLTGGPIKMTDEEMTAVMQAFMGKMQAKMQAQMKSEQESMSKDNAGKGDAYLVANQKKEGWKVTPSGLQYHILTTGTGEKPKATDTVVTNYRGTTVDGKEFDSSYKRNEPAEFPVDQVIPGWTEALQMMPVGSKWELAIPAKLAYGENAPPQIGPNATLLFEVELLGIKKPGTAAAPAPAPALK